MFKALLFSRFAAMFRGRSGTGSKKKTIKILIGLLALYGIGCLFFVFGFLFYSLCEPLCGAGLAWLYFAVMGILIFVVCFIGSIFTTQTQIFEAKDNELLLSLPIKPSAILAARMAALLIMNYIIELTIAVPAAVIYCLYQPVTVLGSISFILVFLLLPLLILAISCLFGWVMALVSSKTKFKKIFTMVFSIGFLSAYMMLYSQMQSYIVKLIENGEEIAQAIKKAAFPIFHLGNSIAGPDITSLLTFILCAVVPFALVYYVLAHNFIKIATANRGTAKVEYKEKTLKVSTIRASLTKKEISHFLSNPVYIMNAALGAIFMVIFAVVLVIKPDIVNNMLTTLPGINRYLAPIGICILCFLASTNMISAPSISLEGKSLWIAKSLPLDASDILLSKAYAHTIACTPSIIFAATVCNIVFPVSLLEKILMYLLPLFLTMFVALFGVIINLHFPKLDWVSETIAIKQSISPMIVMFSSMAITALPIILYTAWLIKIIALDIYLVLCAAVLLLMCYGAYRYLKTKGKKVFYSL